MPSELGPAGSRDPLRAIYEHERAHPRRSRLFTGAVSLLMLGAVALVVYYAYQMGLRAGAQGPAPLIKAEQQPYKVKPDEPGGMDVPNQDKLIYKEVASGAADDTKKPAERLMPQPEAPLPKPAVSAQPITQAEAAQPPQPAAAEPAPQPNPADKAAAAAATPPADAAAKAAPPKQVAQGGGLEAPSTPAMSGSSSQPSAKQAAAPPQVPAPFTAAPAPAAAPPPSSEAQPAAKPETTPVASAEKTPTAAAPAHPRSTGAGGWHVQLGAVRSNEEAQHEWSRLQGKYPDLLGSLTLNVQRVDLGGGKGIYFRIQGGPITERADANALCDKLKALQVGCLAVRQ